MSDFYVEVLIRKNIEKEKKKRQIIMLVILAILIMIGIMTSISEILFLILLAGIGYYFTVIKYCIEFEYYYLNGELIISQIINMSRRKIILELNDGVIKLIAPVASEAMKPFNNLPQKDCTSNSGLDVPYAIVYMHKGDLKIVNIQMTDDLYKELKRDMPYKVKS